MKKKILVPIIISASLLIVAAVVGAILILSNLKNDKNDKKYEHKIEAAEKYYAECEYENAITEYLEAIELQPEAYDAYIGLAEIYAEIAENYYNEEDYEAALAEYEQAIGVLEDGIDNCDSKSKLKKKLAKYQERINEIKIIIEFDDEKAEIQRDLEEKLIESGYSDLYKLLAYIVCGPGPGRLASEESIDKLLSGDADSFVDFYYIYKNRTGESPNGYLPPNATVSQYYVDGMMLPTDIIPLDEFEADAYSIIGKEVDIALSDKISIIELDGVKYVDKYPSGSDWAGEESIYVKEVTSVDYIGNDTWQINILTCASLYSHGFGITYVDMKYGEASVLLVPSEDSYYGFNVVGYKTGKLYDRDWIPIYEDEFKNGTWSGRVYCNVVYIDEDEIPELLCYTENDEVALAVYSIIDGKLKRVVEVPNQDGIVCIYNSIKYIPYANKMCVVYSTKEKGVDASWRYEKSEVLVNVTHDYKSEMIYSKDLVSGNVENYDTTEYNPEDNWNDVGLDWDYTGGYYFW